MYLFVISRLFKVLQHKTPKTSIQQQRSLTAPLNSFSLFTAILLHMQSVNVSDVNGEVIGDGAKINEVKLSVGNIPNRIVIVL